jgi:hypothetical protein
VWATFASRSLIYAAVASVSISTIGGSAIGITKPLRRLFPVSGDDPAFIAFDLGDYDQNFTFKRAGEQRNESAVIPLPVGVLTIEVGLLIVSIPAQR